MKTGKKWTAIPKQTKRRTPCNGNSTRAAYNAPCRYVQNAADMRSVPLADITVKSRGFVLSGSPRRCAIVPAAKLQRGLGTCCQLNCDVVREECTTEIRVCAERPKKEEEITQSWASVSLWLGGSREWDITRIRRPVTSSLFYFIEVSFFSGFPRWHAVTRTD